MANVEGLRHIFPDRNLAIFATPKCGSSSLAKWLIFQRGYERLVRTARTAEGSDVHTMTNIFAERTIDRLARLDFMSAMEAGDPSWRTVKFVRNPYHRAVSSFLQILTLMQNDVELSFKEFIRLPRYYFSNAGVPQINTGEPHARLQATTAEVEGRLRMTHVIALEDGLHDGLRRLENLYDLKDSSAETFAENRLQAKNPTLADNAKSPAAELVYSGAALASGVAVPAVEQFLTDDTKSLIFDRYRDDFDVYGFDPETGELPAQPDMGGPMHTISSERMMHFLRQHNWEEDYIEKPKPQITYDPTDLPSKIAAHDTEMARFQEVISKIGNEEKLVVYGSGELLLNLILSSDLASKNVVAITASSLDGLQHVPLITDNLAWPIVPNDYLKERLTLLDYDKILVASIGSAPEIRQVLAGRLFRVPTQKIISLD